MGSQRYMTPNMDERALPKCSIIYRLLCNDVRGGRFFLDHWQLSKHNTECEAKKPHFGEKLGVIWAPVILFVRNLKQPDKLTMLHKKQQKLQKVCNNYSTATEYME